MAQRGRPKKNISEVKALIEDIKPAANPDDLVSFNGYIRSMTGDVVQTTITKAKYPYTLTDMMPPIPYSPEWVKNVEDYCEKEAITPIELIEQHKSFKKALNSRKTSENKAEVRDLNMEAKTQVKGGDWYRDFAKRKSQGGKTDK